MKSLEKQKLCPNCEARIAIEAEICPYCASELAKPSGQSPLFQSQSLEDSLASLYSPPYGTTKRTSTDQTLTTAHAEASLYGRAPAETPAPQSEKKSSLWPTLLLLTGANLALFGLLQLLFGREGKLILEWDTSFWFFYLLIGAPILYFGFRKLQELGE